MTENAFAPEVLILGRLGVDLYPLQSGVGLEDVAAFGKFLGGSAANVSVALARHGHRSALVSRVGDDPFGRYLLRELDRLGVDNSLVTVDMQFATPVTFCEIFPPDDFPLYFYREPTAPDLQVTIEQVPGERIRDAELVWFTGTGLSEEPSRSTHRDLLRRRAGRGHTVIDLDYRPMFWNGAEEARVRMNEFLAYATVAVGNREECEVAVGEVDPDRAADALLERGVDLAIVKKGPGGVLAKTRGERVEVSAQKVEVVNGLGAGDAFGGALVHGLLERWDLNRILRFANAAGGIVASRLECSSAMPTTDQVEAILARQRA